MPARRNAERSPAEDAPVARICVDVGLAHLDRPFDYLVPADLDAVARPGVRVRVRFAGQLVDGYLLTRVDASEHPGRLAFLERVVSPVNRRIRCPSIRCACDAPADATSTVRTGPGVMRQPGHFVGWAGS